MVGNVTIRLEKSVIRLQGLSDVLAERNALNSMSPFPHRLNKFSVATERQFQI